MGRNVVLMNLQRHITRTIIGANVGLRIAGLTLQRESQDQVPVEFGPLRASAYTRVTPPAAVSTAEIGYTAAYALWVHEATDEKLRGQPRRQRPGGPPPRGNYWDPSPRARSQFLLRPFLTLRPTLVRIIRHHARIR
jgi:hypothetical protein